MPFSRRVDGLEHGSYCEGMWNVVKRMDTSSFFAPRGMLQVVMRGSASANSTIEGSATSGSVDVDCEKENSQGVTMTMLSSPGYKVLNYLCRA